MKQIESLMMNLSSMFMVMVIREFLFMKVKSQLNISEEIFSIEVFLLFRNNIIGLVYARDFALPDTDSGKFTVRNIMNFCKHRYGTSITPDDSSYDVFNLFKKGLQI